MFPKVRDNIVQKVVWCDPSDKFSFLTDLLNVPHEENTAVLVQSSDMADVLIASLKHAESTGSLVVSCPVFIGTLDNVHRLPDVRHVILYDIPTNINDYIESVNCTGRMTRQCLVTSFFCEDNLELVLDLAGLLMHHQQELPPWLDNLAAEMWNVPAPLIPLPDADTFRCAGQPEVSTQSRPCATSQSTQTDIQSNLTTMDQSVQAGGEDGDESTRNQLYYLYSQVIQRQQLELEEIHQQLLQHSFLLAQRDAEIGQLRAQLHEHRTSRVVPGPVVQHCIQLQCQLVQLHRELQDAHQEKIQRQEFIHQLEKDVSSHEAVMHIEFCKLQSRVEELQLQLAQTETSQDTLLASIRNKDATILELQTTCDQLAVYLIAVTAAAQ